MFSYAAHLKLNLVSGRFFFVKTKRLNSTIEITRAQMNRNTENFLKIKTTLEKFSFDGNVQKKVFFYYFNSEKEKIVRIFEVIFKC